MSNVRDFGAMGDGIFDDTNAIQHAMEEGGGLVVFPAGRYRLTRPIRIELSKVGPLSLVGDGATAKILHAGAGPAFHFVGSHEKSADPNSFLPRVWEKERMPMVSNIEITGLHPDSDGILLEGVMQPTLTGVMIRKVRHAVRVVKRARNLLIDHCHFYHNTGVGVFLDHCNLHQTIISGNHISYCRLGGVRIEGGEIRNLQITGNDIEYNNNRAFQIPDSDAIATAEIYIDAQDGTIREGTICSNTIQATYSPNGANIRFIGSSKAGNQRVGMWTISGNLIGSQAINVHLTSALGFAISGNYIYSGHDRNILIEKSRSISLGTNTLGHNPDYGDKELSTGVRIEDSQDVVIQGLLLQDALAGQNTVADAIPTRKEALLELIRCDRIQLTGSQILEGTPNGLLVEDCRNLLMSATTILDRRESKLMKQAIVWRKSRGDWSGEGNLVHGCRLAQGTAIPTGIAHGDNVIE